MSTGASPLYDGAKWVGCPDLTVPSIAGDVERALVAFFRTFSERVAALCRATGKTLPAAERTWSAQHTDNGVEDAPNVRKPDFLLATGDFRWPNIQVHGALKSSNTPANRKDISSQLLNGAYLIFSSQDNRRFIVSLSFVGPNVRLFLFDRAGLITTLPFDLHQDPLSFVRVMTALMFANDPAMLGYDTSIITTGSGRFIVWEGVRYKIVKTLFLSDVIRGRGTVCWHVRHNGQDFVIKDTWADVSRPRSEADLLRKAKDVGGVPKVVADVVVEINGVEGSTDTLRSIIKTKEKKIADTCADIEHRIHRRLVLTPFGEALSHFASRKELISIFIDAVIAHQELFEANILHRDISVNNILLVPSPRTWNTVELLPTSPALVAVAGPHLLEHLSTPSPQVVAHDGEATPPSGPRRGLLIDLDYALVIEPEGERGPTATGHRTGTLPFMAIDVLTDGDQLVEHEPRHDLESMLYVLIWICVYYAGPRNVERQNFDIEDPFLSKWVRGPSYTDIGMTKYYALRNDLYWRTKVVPTFAPYFEPLAPCISAWRQLWVDEKLTYESLLEVLRSALATLPDVEVWSKADDPLGYGEEGKKRKRGFNHLDRINEEHGPKDVGVEEEDQPPLKFSRSATGQRQRAVHSEPPPVAAPKPSIIRSMKPKQQRTLASRS